VLWVTTIIMATSITINVLHSASVPAESKRPALDRPATPLWEASTECGGLEARHHFVSRAAMESSEACDVEIDELPGAGPEESKQPALDKLSQHVPPAPRSLWRSFSTPLDALAPVEADRSRGLFRFSSEPVVGMGAARQKARSSFVIIEASSRGTVEYENVWTPSKNECQRAAFRRENMDEEPDFALKYNRGAICKVMLSSCMEGSGTVVEEEMAPPCPSERAAQNTRQGARIKLETAARGLVRGNETRQANILAP